jgi:putative DNA primase/helicase
MLENKFLDFMLQHGFRPGNIVVDGTYHRFDVHKHGDKCGYYNLDAQGFGVFGDWKNGEQFKFRESRIEKMSEAERQEIARRMRQEKRRQNEEHAQRQAEVAQKAAAQFEAAPYASAAHPYLRSKNIRAHIAKAGPNGRLMVPITEGGKVVNIQFIDGQGQKRFMPGGRKAGCYATIPGDRSRVFIVEGFSTGATVAEATGCEVVIALDAGNLEKIARPVRRKYGDNVPITFAADNDHKGTDNVGLDKATAAAKLIGADVKAPEGIEGTDWNDAAAEGVDVKQMLVAPPESAPVPTAPEPAIERDAFELNENGKPKATQENLKVLLDQKGFRARYNMIAKREEVLIPGSSFSVDNQEVASYACVVSECEREGLGTSHVGEYLTKICDENPYNPVAAWIESKPWDGVDRLPAFYGTIVQEGEADSMDVLNMKEIKLRRWMLSAIAAAFTPNRGISAHGVLVLQGKQYLGKTHWFKKLVPPEHELIKDGYILRIDDKDSLYQCLSHWIVELGELDATFKKSDIAQLKAFLTADRDVMRLPYARKKSTFPRRTVFFASVNKREFLHDETGNRRFWVIPCEEINYAHGLDMQQVWAQFLTMWRQGEPYTMTIDEIVAVNDENESFEAIDPIYERISRHFDWDNYKPETLEQYPVNWRTATEIAMAIGIVNPTNADAQRTAQAVKKLNGGQAKRRSSNIRERLLLVPPCS